MRRRFEKLLRRAASLSPRGFNMLAASSSIATAVVVAAALSPGGNFLAQALAALAQGGPAQEALAQAVDDVSLPPSPDLAGGPSGQAPAAPQTRTVIRQQVGKAPPPGTPTPPLPPVPPPPPPDDPDGPASPVKHIFVINLASPGYDAAFGTQAQMPYLANTLRPMGDLLPGYSLVNGSPLSNAIAMVSGQKPNPSTSAGCKTYSEFPVGTVPDKQTGLVKGDGCVYPVQAVTVADQVFGLGMSWRAYIEDMGNDSGPANCVHPGPNQPDQTQQHSPGGQYSSAHNPFIYFHSLLDLGACTSSDVPLGGLEADLGQASTTPNYSYIAPNLCHSGSGACPADKRAGADRADAFLSEWVPKILASPAYLKDGLLVVTFGEASPADADQAVGTVLVSRFITPGGTLEGDYDSYGLLRSIEDLFGASHLAQAGADSTQSFASSLFSGD